MEFKLCASCGGEAEIVETAFFDRLTYRTRCKDCRLSTDFYDTKGEAEEAWNHRYEPPNEPLTLNELWEMAQGQKPVWCSDLDGIHAGLLCLTAPTGQFTTQLPHSSQRRPLILYLFPSFTMAS